MYLEQIYRMIKKIFRKEKTYILTDKNIDTNRKIK